MTARRWLEAAAARLAATGAPDARLDARWMLADAMETGLAGLSARLDAEISPEALGRADIWLSRRLTGCPLQYAQGRAWFMGHEFLVDERVLIPRQDTELLCEKAIERVGRGTPGVLDLCTGSGALAVSIALARPLCRVWACDLSAGALRVAGENAARLGARVAFLQGDFLAATGDMRFDLIVCNPPYLTRDDMARLQAEVRFEPEMALFGGDDGLDFYRRLAREAREHLNPGGWLLVEVGAGQAQDVAALLGGKCAVYRDLPGVERVVEKQY